MNFPKQVKIVEVGPRDGLQNERKIVPTDLKIQFIELLAASGLSVVESTSFVSPQWVPQMADSQAVMRGIQRKANTRYPVLVPNVTGLDRALACQVDEIAVFATVSESFCQRNINCSIAESIERFKPVIAKALQENIRVRAYISCVIACPYEGKMATTASAILAEQLTQLGCYEVSLGDTLGVATANEIQALIKSVNQRIPLECIACHFHDTYGQALTNIYAALQLGVTTFDSAVSGLGGCPYAKGASGNVATEDLLYMLAGLGIATGVDLSQVIKAGKLINKFLRRKSQSRVAIAIG